jgi:hypothetical protein
MARHRHIALSILTIAVAAAGAIAQQKAPVGYNDTSTTRIARNRASLRQGPYRRLQSRRRTTQLSSSARETI